MEEHEGEAHRLSLVVVQFGDQCIVASAPRQTNDGATCDSGVPGPGVTNTISGSSYGVVGEHLKARIDLMHVTPGIIRAMLRRIPV